MKRTYTADVMASIALFSRITHVDPRDCFKQQDNQLIFVVDEGKAGLAIGRGGANIQKMERIGKKRIKVVEYNPDACVFFANIIYPLKAQSIQPSEKGIKVTITDTQIKARLIGRNRQNLDKFEGLFHQYFKEEVEIV